MRRNDQRMTVKRLLRYVVALLVTPVISIYVYIQGVPGGKDLTSGECSLGQTIPI